MTHTGRDEDRIALVEAYAKENGFWRGDDYAPIYTDTLQLDMGTIVPAISGPKRPQDYIALTSPHAFREYVRVRADPTPIRKAGKLRAASPAPRIPATRHHKRGR